MRGGGGEIICTVDVAVTRWHPKEQGRWIEREG